MATEAPSPQLVSGWTVQRNGNQLLVSSAGAAPLAFIAAVATAGSATAAANAAAINALLSELVASGLMEAS